MTMLDSHRTGYKPDQGQNHWTRACQNSGDDKKRRPKLVTSLDELSKEGYEFNSKNGFYERIVTQTKKNGSKKKILLRAVKLPDIDKDGNMSGQYIYWICGPEENGEHMYIGFLTRSINPYGLCMPCGFKKDHLLSKSKEKRNFYLNCIGQQEKTNIAGKSIGDRLYILQDTNKIQEDRMGMLPKYLDIFFNILMGKTKKFKSHHYLISADKGYYFKYGSRQDEFPFLNSISSIYESTIDDIKSKILNILENDKHDQLFTSLNNGDIKTQFLSREKYIEFIKNGLFLDYDILRDILCIPNVLYKYGANIIVFNKTITVIKKSLEKEQIKEDYVML
jgi:hypothetical protein